eukprot:gene1391-biopygen1383
MPLRPPVTRSPESSKFDPAWKSPKTSSGQYFPSLCHATSTHRPLFATAISPVAASIVTSSLVVGRAVSFVRWKLSATLTRISSNIFTNAGTISIDLNCWSHGSCASCARRKRGVPL